MFDPLQLLELHEQRQLSAELDRAEELRRDFGLMSYKPHEKQDLFHRAGIYKRRYLRTGNRFGKSLCGSSEDVAFALGYRPWYPEGDPARYAGIPQRSTVGVIVVSTWKKAEEIFTNQIDGHQKGKLFKLIPKNSLDGCDTVQGNVCCIRVRSKWGGISTINLITVEGFKRNPLGAESGNYDWIHIDEPCPQKMWKALARGLVDTNGSAWFTCTPIMEMWINDLFLPDGNFRDFFGDGHVTMKDYDGQRLEAWMLTGSIHDNPFNTAEAKAQFLSELTSDEREAREDGRPLQLAGAIYKQFHPEEHIYRKVPKGWKDFHEPPLDYCIRVAIDTHPTTPHAALFAATAPAKEGGKSYTFFWAEIFQQVLIPNYCKLVFETLNGRWPQRCLLELAAYNDVPTNGITMSDLFYQSGLPVEAATKDLQMGIMKVQADLAARDAFGHPYLMFSPHLYETLREFDRYVWDTDKGKPVDRDDHMMENLYRLVLTGLEYLSPKEVPSSGVQRLNVSNVALTLPRIPQNPLDDFDDGRRYDAFVKKRYRREAPVAVEAPVIYLDKCWPGKTKLRYR